MQSSRAELAHVDMPDMTAGVSMARLGCVAVTFSGQFQASQPTGSGLGLRALLDGALMEGHRAVTGDVGMYLPPGEFHLVSYTFWKCDVAPGAHTVKIQWRSGNGVQTWVTGRSAVIFGR